MAPICISERNIVAKTTPATSQIAIERSTRSATITLPVTRSCLREGVQIRDECCCVLGTSRVGGQSPGDAARARAEGPLACRLDDPLRESHPAEGRQSQGGRPPGILGI